MALILSLFNHRGAKDAKKNNYIFFLCELCVFAVNSFWLCPLGHAELKYTHYDLVSGISGLELA